MSSDPTRAQILAMEEQLRLAMLHSDVATLDELIAPELLFTSHLGAVVGKEDDLAAHRSGLLQLSALTPSEPRVLVVAPGVAVVAVRMRLAGVFAGAAASGDFCYTRVWSRGAEGRWRIVAGHASQTA